jgi:HD superfamily phosphohydrolase
MLQKKIEDLVASQLKDVQIEKSRDRKLIRDALTGSMILEKHEVNIIDLPLVQRLRRIHQTGLAYYTYPCTIHNRFQHTLGVTNIVTKLTTSMREKEKEYKSLLDDKTIDELRVAAIFHDIGMGPFSHVTEEILKYFPEVQEMQRNPKFSKAKIHEMLGYLIITSTPFKEIIQKINKINNKNIDIKRVANMIVGDMDEPQETYLSDLINGPFDADKLDYMPRDAYFSGLKIEVDVERIAYTSIIDVTPDNRRRLCTDVTAAHNLEQILFNKVLLFSTIYHHHKVRALVCMIKGIFEILQEKEIQIDDHTFTNVTDFLTIDDYYLLSRLKFIDTPDLVKRVKDIENRKLLKRALVISKQYVENPKDYQILIKHAEKPEALRELRELIVDEVSRKGEECSVYDVWIDLPEPVSLREPSQCFIKLRKGTYTTLNKVFPTEWWLRAYEEIKWRGHVFCPPRTQLRKLISEASRKVFNRELGVSFTEDSVRFAKIPTNPK